MQHEEKYILKVLVISVSSGFFSSFEMTCMYFGTAHSQYGSMRALPLLTKSWSFAGWYEPYFCHRVNLHVPLFGRQADREKERGKKCPADVNEDHTVLDNITVYLNHPLPLIY